MDTEGNKMGDKISYTGTEFHRVVKGMYIQGGNIGKVFRKYNNTISNFI